jgi:hypothetical protein
LNEKLTALSGEIDGLIFHYLLYLCLINKSFSQQKSVQKKKQFLLNNTAELENINDELSTPSVIHWQ